jgi:hypothetical protein
MARAAFGGRANCAAPDYRRTEPEEEDQAKLPVKTAPQ